MRTYVLVWLVLVALTGATVSVAGMDWERWGMALALIIAFFKSGLILNYFMHLKDEKGSNLFKWILPGVLSIFILFIGLTFLDVAFR